MPQQRSFLWSRWTAPEIMLAVLFLLAPLYYHPNLGGAGLRIPDNSTIWLAALVFITYSLNKVVRASTFRLPAHFAYIAAFPLLIILSGFVAGIEQPLEWLFRVLFILGGFAFFFSLFQHDWKPWKRDRLLLVITLSGLIQALIGVMQIWLKSDMPFFLPKSPDGIPFGLFQQVNNHASFLATVVILIFYLASRPFFKQQDLTIKTLIYVTVFLAILTITVSGSRTGFLALTLALPLILSSRRRQFTRNKLSVLLLLLSMMGGAVTGVISGAGSAAEKATAMNEGYSGSARLSIYTIAVELFSEKPLFGHGIGSIPREFQQARPDFYAEHPDGKLPKEMVRHLHNEILQWLVEGGAIAIIAILSSIVGVILALYHAGLSRGWAYAAMLTPITLHTQVELPFYTSSLHWFLFLFILAQPFFYKLVLRRNVMTTSAQKLTLASVFLSGFLATGLLLHTMRANWDFVSFYAGKESSTPLSVARENPFFSGDAEWLSMGGLLSYSMDNGRKDMVVHFTEWGERRLSREPDQKLYIKLIKAYAYLGEKDAFCTRLTEARHIYPNNKELSNIHSNCKT